MGIFYEIWKILPYQVSIIPTEYLFKILSPAVWQQIALVLALINAINFEDTVSQQAVELCHMVRLIVKFADIESLYLLFSIHKQKKSNFLP